MRQMRFSSEPTADEATKDVIRNAIDEGNMVITGRRDYHPLAILLRDETGEIQGGALGYSWGGWLRLEYLWVADHLRGQGFGTRLLQAAEAEARDHGSLGVYLDSFDFQAPEFYKQYGYQVYAELHDLPPGHILYYLRKTL